MIALLLAVAPVTSAWTHPITDKERAWLRSECLYPHEACTSEPVDKWSRYKSACHISAMPNGGWRIEATNGTCTFEPTPNGHYFIGGHP